jgi:TonB-dependent starch-binding outer membrane protein SusC
MRTGWLITAATLLVSGVTARIPAQQQPATGRVEGVITDARSQAPIANATVLIQALGLGAQTNDRGRYTLVNVPVGEQRVQVRRLGFGSVTRTVTVQAGQTATVDVTLSEAVISLDEVVVTGTAAVTRAKEVPTSTAVVNSDEVARAPVVDAQQVLQGRVPSVTILANSGQPGAGGSVQIRGTNTLTQSTSPLIYVDGVRIFNEPTRNNWGARTASSPLQDINAEDIDRIEVVKGAAATTLYGTEAAGGVIQIFTKKGLAGTPQWNASASGGANVSSRWGAKGDPTELFINCNKTEQMYGLLLTGSKKGTRQYFVDPTCPKDGSWTQAGPLQQYDLSVAGGANKLTYFVSGNYGDVQGILPSQRSKDGGFRGNFSVFPLDQLQFQLTTAYTKRNTRWAGDGNNSEGFLLNVGRGPFNYMKGGKGDDCAGVSEEVVCVTNNYVFNQSLLTRGDHFLSGLTVNYNPVAKLSNRFSVGWDYLDMQNITNLPFGFLTLPAGYFWDENTRHTKLSLDYTGSWLQNLFRSGQSTFSWGAQLYRDKHRWTELDVQDFAGPGEPTLKTGAELTYREDLPSGVTNAGFFLQEQLAWHDRLFITGGLRVDGNSAFGENFGLQTYPKIGASYVVSDHAFWPVKWWDMFKMRAAIGESGKAPGAFDKLRTWAPVTGDENKPGFTPNDVGNPDIGPERTRELEGGFDASFAGGRLGLEFTAFRARTLDALVPVTLPPSNGFLESRIANVGELRNSGIEAQVTAGLLRARNFDWTARANYSSLSNEAVDLGEQTEVYTGLGSYIKTGKRFPAYYGKVVTNPNAFAAPTTVDTLIGNVNPDRLWGLGTTFKFFNRVSVDAFVEHQGGFYVQNYTGYQNARRGAWFPCYDTQEKVIAGNVSDVTALQRARCASSGYDIGFWTEKGDFTKLRYVSLTYQIPARLIQARNASITFAGRNLVTWTDYNGGDPEVQDVADQGNLADFNGAFGRRDYYQIPQPKSFVVTFKVGF